MLERTVPEDMSSSSSMKPYAGKRALDLFVAGSACAAFAPLVAGIAAATWLRRRGIDELPQFVKVLRGEMSVVGPRPLTQQDVERCAVKPGITGLSQLLAGPAPRATRLLDRLYLRRQSLMLDMRLIALSFAVHLTGKRNMRRWLKAAE